MADYLSADVRRLIAELDSVASWYEELTTCTNEFLKYKMPKDYVVPVYEDFSEKCGKSSGMQDLWIVGFPIVYLFAYYILYFKTNIMPDGFFMGIFMLVVALLIGCALWFFGLLQVEKLFPYHEPEEDKQKRYQEYLEKKKEFDEKNRAAKEYNDRNWFEYKTRLEALGDKPPENSIPPAYLYPEAIRMLISYLENGRASNLKEAINLFHQEMAMNAKLAQMEQQMQAQMYQVQQMVKDTNDKASIAAGYAQWAAINAGNKR